MVEVLTRQKIAPNQAQQKCIDKLNGQIMALAGPGTGKTFTVIQRVSKMIEEGIKPQSILCLTFSDAAASEMRHRIVKQIGFAATTVNIFTYHSFCNEIIKKYPEQFGMESETTLITDTIKRELLIESIDEADIKAFVTDRGGKYAHINTFSTAIEKIKSQRITNKDYETAFHTNPNLIRAKEILENEIIERETQGEMRNTTRYKELDKIKTNIEKAHEIWKVYELYNKKMIEHNYIDFADMINLVIEEFDNDTEFLNLVSKDYQYFIVDEYQDTNDLQNKVLFSILSTKSNPNIFVVGDDDQIIYGFQGANSENIENFLKKYPQTEVVCLTENNRSTQTILDMSYKILSQDTTRLESNPLFREKNITKKLTAKNQKIIANDRKIKRIQFGEITQEYNYIVEDIEKLVNSDKCPKSETGENQLSEIAIISKKKKELNQFAELLKAKNIPIQLNDGLDIFSIKSSLVIYSYLKALNNHILSSDKLFGLLISEPFNISLKDYNKLLNEYNRKLEDKNDFITNMRTLSDWDNPKKISEFLEIFDYLKEYASTNNLRNTIIEVLNRTGILKYFIKTPINRLENILGIESILNQVTDFMNMDKSCTLNDFISKLDYCKENDIQILTEKNNVVQNAIQLITYHGSKGREFSHVYLPNLLSTNWENFSMKGEYKLITDEILDKEDAQIKKDSELIKLLFVGITRAKYDLTISHSEVENKKTKTVTKYLDIVKDFDFDKKEFEYKEDNSITEFVKSISRETQNNRLFLETEMKSRANALILSASSINNYIRCPKDFMYKYILNIDIKESDWDSANFGSIIHKILENSARQALDGKGYLSKDEAIESFNTLMDKEIFKTKDKKETLLKRGYSIFENYYPHFCETPISMLIDVEKEFDGITFGKYQLDGKIDRVEKLSDGTYALYDYKTSTPASKNQYKIGGSKEDYYNQLCCYKYAFEKMEEKKVSKVGIIYVEDHAKNVTLELTKDEMDYIENLVKETYENIRNLKFDIPINQDIKSCKYCAYKDLCKLDVI